MNKKENWIDLSSLPKRKKYIDWKKIKNTNINFYYDGTKGFFTIENCCKNKVSITYKGRLIVVKRQDITGCNLSFVKRKNFLYEVGQTLQRKNQNFLILDKHYAVNHVDRKYFCACSKCLARMWLSERQLKMGGCPVCHGKKVVVGINDITTTEPWMVKYFQGGELEARKYTKNSIKKLNFVCPDCGKIKQNKISIQKLYQRHLLSCDCGDGISFPEKYIAEVLNQLNVTYERQFYRKWCKYEDGSKKSKCRYDSMFTHGGINYFIEADGGFHYADSNISRVDIVKRTDKMKDLVAKEHGFQMIRVDCRKSEALYIKNSLLNSLLPKLFSMEAVDWDSIYEKSLKNKVKELCHQYNTSCMTPVEISKKHNLSISCVCSYLIKGSRVGWCRYTRQDNLERVNAKRYVYRIRPVAVIKNNKVFRIYNSVGELMRDNYLYGVPKTLLGNKSKREKVCKNGYQFKNIDKKAFMKLAWD